MPTRLPDGYVYDPVPQGSGLLLDTGLGPAPSGYGQEYDRLFQANPYRNLTYKKSFWQQFMSALGFRTDADRWLEDAQVNSAEYDASIYSMIQQNDYNDPASQAERMRQAGLNPDFLGTGDVAGASSPTEDPNGMSPNVGDEFSDFGNTIASVFSRAMAVFKDFKSIEQMNSIIDGQNISNAKNMVSAIDEFILGQFSAEDMTDYGTFKNRAMDLVTQNFALSSDPLNPALELGLSKRQIPQYNKLMHDRLLSMTTDEKVYQQFKNRVDAMAGSKQSETNPFAFSTKGFSSPDSESAVDIMVKGLSRAHKRALEFTAKRDASLASVQSEEAQTLEDMSAGVASARSQVTEYNSKKAVAQWNAECARIKKDMIRDLERSALSGDWLAKAMLFSWSLDDIARLNVSASASLGANFGLGLKF